MSFKNKIMLAIAISCTMCAIAGVFVSYAKVSDMGDQGLIAKSRAILSRLESVRNYVAAQGFLDDLIKKNVKLFPDGKLTDEAKLEVLKSVPVFAALKVGSEDAAKENYQFRVFSDEPRNKDNKATEAELEIFRKFGNDSNLPEIVESIDNKVIVYRPVRLSEKQGCLFCHGNPQNSPFKNGKDIVGHEMENWSDGKLHGVFAIISDTKAVKAAANTATMNIIFWSFGAAAIALAIGFILIRGPLSSLDQIATSLKEAGEQTSLAGNEINVQSQSLSSSTSESAASLEETTASTEEMSSMIKLNADNAESARELSSSCEQKARFGKTEVERLILAMTDISTSSKKIEEIISVIDDISFQTNLLALNAAVEAARAGEQGRGFSVVAEAVRALAQRSAASAKEISSLIKESVEKISQGTRIAEASGVALTEIVSSVEKVASLNTEISGASREQSVGVININKAINELDRVTQQNAASAEETAAASEELSAQSKQLHLLVANLISVMSGKNLSAFERVKQPATKQSYENALPLKEFGPKSSAKVSPRIGSISDFNKDG